MEENTTFYLRNKDLLAEIHKSKNSYSEFVSPDDSQYDLIVYPEDFLLPETVQHGLEYLKQQCLSEVSLLQARENKCSRLNAASKGMPKSKKLTVDDIPEEGLVFRVLSYHYIPDDEEGRKKTPKTIGDTKYKLNFIPFVHFKYTNGEIIEVGRSHYKNGEFNPNGGNISNKLADMFMLLVEKYSQRPNWRGYTYVNEMKGQALLHLVYMGLKFNEHKSDNPFTYYTQTISNSFTRVLNEEKMHQDIRDDLLEESGQNPSLTRQLQNEDSYKKHDI